MVGLIGCVFIFVYVVCWTIRVSDGVCRLGVRLVWLCMHIIDVSEDST